jgi:general secretion pathway protein E
MAIRRVALEERFTAHGVEKSVMMAARSVADKAQIPLREAIQRVEGVSCEAVANALGELSGLPVVPTVDVELITAELIRPMPLNLARDQGVLPLYEADGQIIVGMADLSALSGLDDLRVLLGRPVRPVLVPSDVLRDAMHKAYDKASESATSVLEDVDDEQGKAANDLMLEDADLLDDPNQAPIIRFVNALLAQAIKERASDIHIEPFEKDLVVRFRIDGVLFEAVRPPSRLKSSIVARIKIMAGLNIAEKRLPQDGRIRRRMAGREIDLRVSTLPVRHGERVVMRILEKGEVLSLGVIMDGEILDTFRRLISRPNGILLVSGPTGSGKSTTLYSAISEINTPDKNILTIEDPVEYELRGIGQVQVNHKINLTFGSALRSFLRQDPDVILVGEIRDRETANNAVQASLTGHLVFSTIHTNDAAGAFPRLVDMGVEPFLVASSLLGVLAQRLVRRLCKHCKEPHVPTDVELADLGLARSELPVEHVWRAAGCDQCGNHGYSGRLGIFEFLEADEDIKNVIMANADAGQIKRAALERGMKTLREDGIAKALRGLTTFDEVLRVTREDAE